MKAFKAVPTKENNSSRRGVMSLINPASNTKRIAFKRDFLDSIGFAEGDLVQLQYDDEKGCLFVGVFPVWGSDIQGYRITGYPKTPVIYNTALVVEIASVFKLDYSNRTSITFDRVYYKTSKKFGKPYAKIMI